MTAREMLEFAAKAAGVFVTRKELARLLPKWDWSEEYEPCYFDTGAISGWRIWYGPRGEIGGAEEYMWNPLTDAADRWRLAAACKMTIDFEAGFVLVLSRDGAVLEYNAANEGQSIDWCVVRAAAEIGRNLP